MAISNPMTQSRAANVKLFTVFGGNLSYAVGISLEESDMAKRRLFMYLAAASGYTGIGLMLGYVLSDQATNTPLWVGVALTLLGAILLGMFISAREDKPSVKPATPPAVSPAARPNQEIR